MPKQIKHPCDPSHVFTLHLTPANPEGPFSYDACGKTGSGFSHHCKICAVNLHILCAKMPMSIAHHAQHHILNLVFAPPYHDQGFSCDLCRNTGSKHWLCRCHSCNFDAHLECAKGAESAPPQPGRVEHHPTTFPGSSLVRPGQVHQSPTTYAPPVQAQVQSYQTAPAPPVQCGVRPPPWVSGWDTPGQIYGCYRPPINVVNTGNTGAFGPGRPGQNYGYNRPPNNMVYAGNPGVFGSITPGQSNGVPNNMVNNPGMAGQNNGFMGQVIEGWISGVAEAGQQLFQVLVGGGSWGGGGDWDSYVEGYSGEDVLGMDDFQDYGI
ncbi:hypothetical protein NMG60_11029377 [Bertholletia excelsa]